MGFFNDIKSIWLVINYQQVIQKLIWMTIEKETPIDF